MMKNVATLFFGSNFAVNIGLYTLLRLEVSNM